jgi:hypothetical protein
LAISQRFERSCYIAHGGGTDAHNNGQQRAAHGLQEQPIRIGARRRREEPAHGGRFYRRGLRKRAMR